MSDRDILRHLAEQVAEIANLPEQAETIELWTDLNDLRPVRPLVWLSDITWHELNVDDELTLTCQEPFCREVEDTLRKTIYQWRHMRVDMVVEPLFHCPLAISDSGLGIDVDETIARIDPANPIVSHEYHPQIQDDGDLDRIVTPQVTHDTAESEQRLQICRDAFGDVLTVVPSGIHHTVFAPWDILMRWIGGRIFEYIVDRREMMHEAVSRLLAAYLGRLRQDQDQNLLSFRDGNYRVCSGALGYTSTLPADDFDLDRVTPKDHWGGVAAQITYMVSPELQDELGLRYERQWLQDFGLTYYGCCEPLHDRVHILRSIPNLRKISMSPWAHVDEMVQTVGRDLVLSYKPNPQILARDAWEPELARATIAACLDTARDCNVEMIVKDISTVRYEPQRLWQWADVAMQEAHRVAETPPPR